MDDKEFALELVARLNKLCADGAAKSAVLLLLNAKVDVGSTMDHHPTCHVSVGGRMGPLGMMNGLVGRATICAGYRHGISPEEFLGFYLAEDCKEATHRPVQSPEWSNPADQDGDGGV